MKKTILPLLIMLNLISCNRDIEIEKSNVLDKNYIKNADLKDQISYKKHYLKKAAEVVKDLQISSNDLLNLSLNSESKGQQKNTFLLSDLVNIAQKRNKILDSHLLERIKILENAFKNLDERDYNISIYIPFAQEINNVKSKKLNQDVYIFEENEDTNKIAFQGEILNEDGNWTTYEKLITEEMAEEMANDGTMVIVVGLQDKNIENNIINVEQNSSSNIQNKNFYFEKMAVKNHKETWIGGASEIAIQMIKLETNNSQRINFINSSTFGYNEYIFFKFKRKDIRKRRELYLNTPVAGSINLTPNIFNNTKLLYVIYEADNWPVSKREVNFNGSPIKIIFGSSDNEYYKSSYEANTYINGNVENNQIKFTYKIK